MMPSFDQHLNWRALTFPWTDTSNRRTLAVRDEDEILFEITQCLDQIGDHAGRALGTIGFDRLELRWLLQRSHHRVRNHARR